MRDAQLPACHRRGFQAQSNPPIPPHQTVLSDNRPPRTCLDDCWCLNTSSFPLTWKNIPSKLSPLPRKSHTTTVASHEGNACVILFGGAPSGKKAPSNALYWVRIADLEGSEGEAERGNGCLAGWLILGVASLLLLLTPFGRRFASPPPCFAAPSQIRAWDPRELGWHSGTVLLPRVPLHVPDTVTAPPAFPTVNWPSLAEPRVMGSSSMIWPSLTPRPLSGRSLGAG